MPGKEIGQQTEVCGGKKIRVCMPMGDERRGRNGAHLTRVISKYLIPRNRK